jgi:uncharacterized protein
MPSQTPRCVLDTNVLVTGMASSKSASAKLVDAAMARRYVPLVSSVLLGEYRDVLVLPVVTERLVAITRSRVEFALTRLRYVADVVDAAGVRFAFPRDPRDEKLIELAIAGRTTHLITLDSDLLTLPTSRSDAGRRFRQRARGTAVVTPAAFVQRWGTELGME